MLHLLRFIQHFGRLLARKIRGYWLLIEAIWVYTGRKK